MDLWMSLLVVLILAHLPIFGVLASAGNTWARSEIVGLASTAAGRVILVEIAFGVLLMFAGVMLMLDGTVDAIWLTILGLVVLVCGSAHAALRFMLLRRGIRTLQDLERYREAQGMTN
jgi:hypothetical protein